MECEFHEVVSPIVMEGEGLENEVIECKVTVACGALTQYFGRRSAVGDATARETD